jgi:hypothetical protein
MCLALLIAFAWDEIAGVSSVSFALGAGSFGLLLLVIFALAFACPKCGKSPYSSGPFDGPFSYGGKLTPDRVCSNCGHNLAGPGDG